MIHAQLRPSILDWLSALRIAARSWQRDVHTNDIGASFDAFEGAFPHLLCILSLLAAVLLSHFLFDDLCPVLVSLDQDLHSTNQPIKSCVATWHVLLHVHRAQAYDLGPVRGAGT